MMLPDNKNMNNGGQAIMTSLNLTNLKEASGVFISESDFQVIELQYNNI